MTLTKATSTPLTPTSTPFTPLRPRRQNLHAPARQCAGNLSTSQNSASHAQASPSRPFTALLLLLARSRCAGLRHSKLQASALELQGPARISELRVRSFRSCPFHVKKDEKVTLIPTRPYYIRSPGLGHPTYNPKNNVLETYGSQHVPDARTPPVRRARLPPALVPTLIGPLLLPLPQPHHAPNDAP